MTVSLFIEASKTYTLLIAKEPIIEILDIIKIISDDTITVLCFLLKSNKRSKNEYNKSNNPSPVRIIILKVVSILFNKRRDLNKYA